MDKFNRIIRVTGKEKFNKLHNVSVAIFGVGGVGSWCAESLIRSGVNNLTIIDSDIVCVTNINRQLQATTKTVGQVKVEALKKRLLEINPDAQIIAIEKLYTKETRDFFDLDSFDYVIDAIDSLSCKIELISHALTSDTIIYSSFGAASKLDPTRIQVKQVWKTYGCPLGRLVRNGLKKRRISDKFLCVFSDEVLPRQEVDECQTEVSVSGEYKTHINGSFTHITGIFGFMLAGLVIKDVMK